MKHLAIIAAAVTALAASASAQTTVSQTLLFSGVPDFSSPLLFNKYNGPAVDLTNVQVSYTLKIEGGQFVIDNDADSPADVTAKFGATLDATSSDVNLQDSGFHAIIDDVAALNTGTFSLAANEGDGLNDYSPSGPDGVVLVGVPQSKSGSGNINAMFLNQFVGPGTFTVNAIAKQVASLTSSSGVETATTPVYASGSITITYTVPEPSSAVLLGFAGMAFALRRRRN